MTTSAFKNLTIAEKIFKDLIWDTGILAGELAIEGAVPFLALPVISTLERTIIHELSDWLFNQFVLLVDVAAIHLVNAEHQRAFDSASVKMKVIALDQGLNSPEYRKARTDATATLSKFVHFGAV